ncbi:MAG: Holliday junction branch migration protein RuvA [Saprospiraceae bacterium]|jgi:Holliday junction DNA helicase RuvA|nr:Holliday junction branch migration protein RuvA [Saprospiraceae bacterium]
MIRYLNGPISFKTPSYIIVEAGGVGYEVNISMYTYAKVEPLERVKIHTYLHIKEDSHTLYGFFEDVERKMFTLLISVSGIGPNTAMTIFSGMNPEEVQASILSEDTAAFNRVKGIGPKTAKRIILDLKDKVKKQFGSDITIPVGSNVSPARQEAISALIALGFNRIVVQKAVNKVLRDDPSIQGAEQIIRSALKQLS